MDNFKISFTQNINPDKITKGVNRIATPQIVDDFVKAAKENPMIKEFSEFLNKIDFEEFTNSMLSRECWTDTLNTAIFRRRKDVIKHVDVSLLDMKTGEQNADKIYLPEFKNLMTEYTAKSIDKHPQKEQEYKNLYLKIINYIDKNS